jgi:hypothetical protein
MSLHHGAGSDFSKLDPIPPFPTPSEHGPSQFHSWFSVSAGFVAAANAPSFYELDNFPCGLEYYRVTISPLDILLGLAINHFVPLKG